MKNEELKGIVKFFNYDSGYGFVEVEGNTGSDYYIHASSLYNNEKVYRGDTVEFKAIESPRRKGIHVIVKERGDEYMDAHDKDLEDEKDVE